VSITSVVGEVISFLAALGLGSALGQYLASSKDRRESRANVLSALAEVEAARWAGGRRNVSLPDFQASMRKFQTAALIYGSCRSLFGQRVGVGLPALVSLPGAVLVAAAP